MRIYAGILCALGIICGSQSWASPDMPAEKIRSLAKKSKEEVISDAAFFGVFENGGWKRAPMLDYNYSPQLKQVEESAQKGDYEKAASELLAYYRQRNIDYWPTPTDCREEMLPLWKDQIFGFDQMEFLVTVFSVSKQSGEVKIDLDVKKVIEKGTLTFEMIGRHKNGIVSYVLSRESEKPPILELRFKNGKTVELKPSADTFVRAGKSANLNFGGVKELEICYSGLKAGKPFDDDTRQTLIGFDLSKINPSQVRSAILKLTARSDGDGQQVMLFKAIPTVVNEKKDKWNTVIGYQYSWEGLPGGYDWDLPEGAHSQFTSWTRRMYFFSDVAAKALKTGKPEDCHAAIAPLMDFIRDYPASINRPPNDLNCSARTSFISMYLPKLLKLPGMTPRYCVELLKQLTKDGEQLYIEPSKLERSNLDNMGMSLLGAQLVLCTSFPELAAVPRWRADAAVRMDKLLDHMVLTDGAYTEHTMGYPYGVLRSLLDLKSLYAKTGLKPPATLDRKIQQLARYLMFCSFPDGSMLFWGEGWPRNSKEHPAIPGTAKAFNDPELLWWTEKGQVGRAPKDTVISFPEAKIGILRNSWQADGNVMFVSSRAGGNHYHVDQNGLALFAYGKLLLNDTGMTSYSGKHPHFDWQRHQTKSHNTVEVDEKGFPRIDTYRKDYMYKEEAPCGSAVFDSTSAALFDGWGGGYLNVRHERKVFFLKEAGLYFVYDLLIPNDGKSHTYDQCWHLNPSASFKSDKDTCRIWTDDPKEANIEIIPLFPAKLQLLIRQGFNAVPSITTTYPSFRQDKVSGNAEFLTVLIPTKPGQKVGATAAKLLETGGSAKALEVDLPNGPGVFVVSRQGKAMVKAWGIETDGRCAYVQFDHEKRPLWAVVYGGKALTVNTKAITFIPMLEVAPPALPEK